MGCKTSSFNKILNCEIVLWTFTVLEPDLIPSTFDMLNESVIVVGSCDFVKVICAPVLILVHVKFSVALKITFIEHTIFFSRPVKAKVGG